MTNQSPTQAPGYGALLKLPQVSTFVPPALLGRFSLATRSFTAALLVQEVTGSYGDAGVIGGWMTLVAALAAPRLSRMVVNHGLARIMISTMVLHVGAGIGLVFAAYQQAPLVVLLLFATLCGITAVSFGSLSRAAWTRVATRGPALDRAFAFEAVMDDLAFIIAPSVAIPVTLAVHPASGFLGSVAITAIASLLMCRAPNYLMREQRTETVETDRPKHRSIFHVLPLRVLMASLLFMGMVFGSIELMLVAFARELERESMATVLLVLVAIGSGTGGIAYGAARWRMPLPVRLIRLSLIWACSMVAIVFVNSIVLMAIAAIVAGFLMSPTLIAGMTLTERITPQELITESFAWLGSAVSVGAAAGIFLVGWIIDAWGADGAQLLVVACGFATWLVLFRFRSQLSAENSQVQH